MRAQFSDRVFCLQILFFLLLQWNFHLHLLGVWVLWQLSRIFCKKQKKNKSVSFYDDDRREKCTLVLIEELTAAAVRESLLLPILNFASTAFLICYQAFFPFLPCELLSAVFLPNTKLKAYKNHHKDSEGRDFLYFINWRLHVLHTVSKVHILSKNVNVHFSIKITF